MSWWNKTALVLANIGAVNWGLDLMGWNAVSWMGTTVSAIVYVIVALCGIWGLVQVFKK